MLKRFNSFIEKWMALVTPTCLLLGVCFPDIAKHGLPYVPAVFAFITFSGRSDVSGYDRDTFSAGSGCIVRETAGTEERRIKRQIKNETAGFPVMEPGSLRIM